MNEPIIKVSAQWVVDHNGGLPDHACSQCVSGEANIDGFVCNYHRALEALGVAKHAELVDLLIDELYDRCGFDEWWNDINKGVKLNIKRSLAQAIENYENERG